MRLPNFVGQTIYLVNMKSEMKSTSIIKSVLTNKCPKCRTGELFLVKNPYQLKHTLKMHEHCEVCGQKTEPEVGFYYGTGYVSYGLSIGLTVFNFIWWALLIGISFRDNSIFYFLATNIAILILMQPIIMRLSRTLYLSIFVPYDPLYKKEIVI